MLINKKQNSGMALVSAILLMLVLVIFGFAMVQLAGSETRREVRSRMRESALYVADAGIEQAIHDILNGEHENSFTVQVGTYTGDLAGEADVEISLSGRIYTMTSTGYSPTRDNPIGRRILEVKGEIEPEQPQEAMRAAGTIDLASNVKVYGVIRSNNKVTFSGNNHIYPDSNGNAGVVTSSNDGVDFAGSVEFHGAGPYYIRSAGPIEGTSNVTSEEGAVIFEPDSYVEPMEEYDIPFYELYSITAAAVASSTVYETHQEFNTPFDLGGKTHWFKGGVTFKAEVTGEGTILATGGQTGSHGGVPYNRGISFPNASVNIGDSNDFQKINLIVDDLAGADATINFNSNIYMQGYVYCPGNLNIPSKVEIKGVVEVGGDSNLSSNTDIIFDTIAYEIPGGGSGGVNLISWAEK